MKKLLTLTLLLLATPVFAQNPFDELRAILRSQEFAKEAACSTITSSEIDKYCGAPGEYRLRTSQVMSTGKPQGVDPNPMIEKIFTTLNRIERKVDKNTRDIAALKRDAGQKTSAAYDEEIPQHRLVRQMDEMVRRLESAQRQQPQRRVQRTSNNTYSKGTSGSNWSPNPTMNRKPGESVKEWFARRRRMGGAEPNAGGGRD